MCQVMPAFTFPGHKPALSGRTPAVVAVGRRVTSVPARPITSPGPGSAAVTPLSSERKPREKAPRVCRGFAVVAPTALRGVRMGSDRGWPGARAGGSGMQGGRHPTGKFPRRPLRGFFAVAVPGVRPSAGNRVRPIPSLNANACGGKNSLRARPPSQPRGPGGRTPLPAGLPSPPGAAPRLLALRRQRRPSHL